MECPVGTACGPPFQKNGLCLGGLFLSDKWLKILFSVMDMDDVYCLQQAGNIRGVCKLVKEAFDHSARKTISSRARGSPDGNNVRLYIDSSDEHFLRGILRYESKAFDDVKEARIYCLTSALSAMACNGLVEKLFVCAERVGFHLRDPVLFDKDVATTFSLTKGTAVMGYTYQGMDVHMKMDLGGPHEGQARDVSPWGERFAHISIRGSVDRKHLEGLLLYLGGYNHIDILTGRRESAPTYMDLTPVSCGIIWIYHTGNSCCNFSIDIIDAPDSRIISVNVWGQRDSKLCEECAGKISHLLA